MKPTYQYASPEIVVLRLVKLEGLIKGLFTVARRTGILIVVAIIWRCLLIMWTSLKVTGVRCLRWVLHLCLHRRLAGAVVVVVAIGSAAMRHCSSFGELPGNGSRDGRQWRDPDGSTLRRLLPLVIWPLQNYVEQRQIEAC